MTYNTIYSFQSFELSENIVVFDLIVSLSVIAERQVKYIDLNYIGEELGYLKEE